MPWNTVTMTNWTRAHISKVRDAATEIDKIGLRFEFDSEPGMAIASLVNHLMATAKANEADLVRDGEQAPGTKP